MEPIQSQPLLSITRQVPVKIDGETVNQSKIHKNVWSLDASVRLEETKPAKLRALLAKGYKPLNELA